MLNNSGFNQWSESYDAQVKNVADSGAYPFSGYYDVMNQLYHMIKSNHAHTILDIGIGTGYLSSILYKENCTITGVDFSEEMLSLAQVKMPHAQMIVHDFSCGLPNHIMDVKFDAIICTYAIHHLIPSQQIDLINEMLEHLTPRGCIFIGDIAFRTLEDKHACKNQFADIWDEDEYYPVAEEWQKHYPSMKFYKKSFCAGIFVIGKH